MELVLTIIASIGILLLVTSYLAYVLTGFKHHFITGLISTLPVLNIVTLPALWQKAAKKFLLGLFGLFLLGTSWFFGADKGVKNLISKIKGEKPITVSAVQHPNSRGLTIPTSKTTITSGGVTLSPIKETATSKPFSNTRQRLIDETEMQGIPNAALYVMAFEPVAINKITTLSGRIIKVKTDKESIEGRLINVNNSTITIKSGGKNSVEQEFPIANISELQLMVKKAK